MHAFVRLKFLDARDPDRREIGLALEFLGQLRNRADDQIDTPGRHFASGAEATAAIDRTDGCIARLDGIEADDEARDSAIAAIRSGPP